MPPRRACRWSVGLRRTRLPSLDDVHETSLHGVSAHNHKQAHRGFLAGGRTHEELEAKTNYVLNFSGIFGGDSWDEIFSEFSGVLGGRTCAQEL